MYRTTLLLALAALLIFVGEPCAASKDLMFFDLSLAGYRLGMTYDEATLVRPFDIVAGTSAPRAGGVHYTASVDHLFVDDVQMNMEVLFVGGTIVKIIGKFTPSAFEGVVQRLHLALGSSENKSRVIKDKKDTERHQVIFRWDFPNAQVHLISLSSTSDAEFAAVSLVAKKQPDQDEKGQESK